MKKKHAVKRPSTTDQLTASIAQDFAHQNSYTINSRKRVLEFEAEEIEKAIVAMTGSLASIRARQAKVRAMLRGLEAIIAKR